MKTLCIYHANCADGFGAAWVVRKALGADNVDFHPGKYGEPAPEVEGRDVILVDFSYKRDQLLQLAQSARSVLIIDHHKSAAEDLAELPVAPPKYSDWLAAQQPLGAVFDMQRSGAGLTWDYFYPFSPRPRLINHIEDRDLWRFALPGTKAVTAALFSHAQDFHLWDDLMKRHLSDLRGDGHAILRAHDKNVADLVPNARRLTIGGQDVPALNCPHFMASDAGHILAQGEPFAACYSDTPKGRVFSLRSQPEGLDVSEIAKQYGGGGHRNAAGFTVPFDHELVTGYVLATLESTDTEQALLEAQRGEAAYNAVIDYMLNAGRGEEPLQFLHAWNDGNFDALRREWPDAPIAIYYADVLADHAAIDAALQAELEVQQ